MTIKNNFLADVSIYYESKLGQFGTTPRGVDWRDKESQKLRFIKLAQLFPDSRSFSVNDLGCGYGAFANFLNAHYPRGRYCGYDISKNMISAAQKKNPEISTNFFHIFRAQEMKTSDYTISSGIFNVKLNHHQKDWENFVLKTIGDMNHVSRRGFSFNVLTSYSDKDKKRADLYYADPCFLFDFCKKHFSKKVTLCHDYNLYEFTIVVRKD